MRELRANTQVIVPIGPAVAVGDGFTPVTTLTLSGADEAELLKHGSTTVVDISGATFAAITSMDGHYALTLTTSHLDTEGLLRVAINDDSLILPIKEDFMVLSEAAWDSKYIAKDDGFMDVNIKTVGRADTQETEANNLEAACAAYSATRGLSGTALPAAAADAAGGLPISDAGGLDLDARLDAAVSSRMATYTQPTGFLAATFPTTVASTTNITAGTITTVTNLTNAPTNGDFTATMKTSIATELATYDAPTNAEMEARTLAAASYATAAAQTTAQNDLDILTGSDGVILATTQPNYAPATAAALASLVTTVGVAGAGLTEAGGDGDHLTNINLPNQTMDITGNITGNLSGSVGSTTALGAQAKADVNAEMLDVLNVDTFAQPGQESPAATTTLQKMLAYLYKAWRNKTTQTSSEYALYADDATTKDQEAVVSDDGTTTTRGEVSTGA